MIDRSMTFDSKAPIPRLLICISIRIAYPDKMEQVK